MTEQITEDLFQALYRESALYADNLGLPLTGEQLHQVKARLVLATVTDLLFPHKTIEESMKYAYFGIDE